MRAVLFDIDGTILTEMPLIQLFLPQIYEELSKKFGISRDEARAQFLSEIVGRRDTYDWHDWNFFFKLFVSFNFFFQILDLFSQLIDNFFLFFVLLP